MVEKCVFNPKLSLGIIQKGFNKSFTEGYTAVKNEAVNLYTNIKERFAPKQARFDEVAIYKYKNGKMFWQGDSMPVADHLRRFALLLEFQGGSLGWVAQAKRDQQIFDVVQEMAKDLKPGQAIQYLSKKDPDPNKGVSLQQIVNDNGVLKHQSHLLPFNDADQIDRFIDLANGGRVDLSLDEDISGWIVTGDKIDFDKDLPEMVIGSMLPEQVSPDRQQLLMPAWPKLTSTPNLDFSVETDVPDRVVSVEPSSFWWQLLAEQAMRSTLIGLPQLEATVVRTIGVKDGFYIPVAESEITDSEFEILALSAPLVNTETVFDTSGPGLEVQEVVEDDNIVEPTKTVLDITSSSEPEVTTVAEPARTVPVGVQEVELPSRFNLEGSETVEPVSLETKTPTPVYIVGSERHSDSIKAPKTANVETKKTVIRHHRVTVKPSRIILEGQPKEQKPEIVVYQKAPPALPPLWQVKLEPLNDKEIPFWQPGFNDFEINDALVLVVVTMFFLIANTVWRQPEQTFFNSRGSG